MPWDRPLTASERWPWLFDHAAPMNLVLVARLDGQLDRDLLRDSLGVVAGHFPQLTASIVADKSPRLVSGDRPIELRVLPFEAGAWRQVAVEEANARIPTRTGPLMRATLLDGEAASDLILTFSQVAADGRSAALIIDELLRVHGGGARPAVAAPEIVDPPLPAAAGSRLQAMQSAVVAMLKRRRTAELNAGRDAPPEQRRTGLIDARLPASHTAALGLKAATHGSSVHGVLVAAMLLSVGDMIRSADRLQHVDIACASAIDLRPAGGVSPTAVGNLMSRVVSSHRLHHDTLFWDLAAEVSGAIREATRSGAMFADTRMMMGREGRGGTDAYIAKKVAAFESSNHAAVIVNNLGIVDAYPRYGDVNLERLGFLVSNNALVGSALTLNASTAAGTTCLNFTYGDPLLPREHAQTLVDGVLETLQEVLDDSRAG